MDHLRFCIDEMMAEIDAKLAVEPAVKALAQFDEREQRGEPLAVIDSVQLRDHLERQTAALPMMQARRKLTELKVLLEVATATAPTATQTSTPAAMPAPLAELSKPDQAVASAPEPKIVPMNVRPPQPARKKPLHQRLAEATAVGTGAIALCALMLPPPLPEIARPLLLPIIGIM